MPSGNAGLDPRSLKRRVTMLLAGAVGVALLTLVAACAVNPVTGEQYFSLMSEATEMARGRELYPVAVQEFNGPPPDDPDLQLEVRAVGHALAAVSHRPHVPWEFTVVNSSVINAFALPGGKIAITRGLVARMQSEDELASVLGHEVGHVTSRHADQHYSRGVVAGVVAAGIGLGVAIATNDETWGRLGYAVAGAGAGLVLLSYSRDQERQADELGYDYMVKAGYNPRGQVAAFELMAREERGEPGLIAAMLRSHPVTSERVTASRERVAGSTPEVLARPVKTDEFQQALAKQRERLPAYQAMDQGDALMGRKLERQAAAQYRRAAELFPGEGLFQTRQAMAELAMNRPGEAVAPAETGARLAPGVYLCQHIAGLANLKSGRFGRAAPYFDQAGALLPQNSAAPLLAGACYEKIGNRSQASLNYQRALKLDPKGEVGKLARQRLAKL